MTDPWPEFYLKNKGSYNYTLAEPSEADIKETFKFENNSTEAIVNVSETYEWQLKR